MFNLLKVNCIKKYLVISKNKSNYSITAKLAIMRLINNIRIFFEPT